MALAWAAWLCICVVWGTTYLAIRIALETLPPALMGAMRWIAAGTLLSTMLRARGERLPEWRAWPSLALLGVLMIGVGNGGVVWAEQTVPSGLTAVLVSSTPFWIVGIERVMPNGDALTLRRLAGLSLGFSGIVLLVWPFLVWAVAASVIAWVRVRSTAPALRICRYSTDRESSSTWPA